MRFACAWLLGCVALLTWVPETRAQQPFRFPEAKCENGELRYIEGVPVLTVAGTPEEMGRAIGLLALKPGRRMASYPDDLLNEFYLSFLRTPFLHAGRRMVDRFPRSIRAEMDAMIAASELSPDLAVLGNTMFDLKKVIACSTLGVEPQRSATGGSLMARNLDYPPLGYAQHYSLVTVFKPALGKHNFATVGFPGVVGCLSGMNDAGLAVAVLEVAQSRMTEIRFNIEGLPYALCYRKILEECATIDEAYKLLCSLPRTGLSNLAVIDRQGAAVFEITPEKVVLRRGENGTCAAANHFCSEALRPWYVINFYSTVDRFDSLTRLGELKRPLGPGELHAGLHEACHKTFTLQAMIFDSKALRLHLATGTVPATAGEMRVVDLAPLLLTPLLKDE